MNYTVVWRLRGQVQFTTGFHDRIEKEVCDLSAEWSMPTPEQLKAYADRLPQIYRDLLIAFQEAADPYRRYGEGMSVDVLQVQLANRGVKHTTSEVHAALEQLEKAGFLTIEVQELTYVCPTPLGEELIEVLSGKRVSKVAVPELPIPTW